MGRVFTWEEVSRGHVPVPDAFERTAAEVRRVLPSFPGILAGTLCGSVLRHDCSLRSDIDCVVIYEAARARSVMGILQTLALDAAERFVPLEFIPLAADMAATPLHHINPLFAAHMMRAVRNGGMLRADPMRFLNLEQADVVADFRSYLTYKLHRFETGLSRLPALPERERCRLYQKALEAPVHIARKVVALHAAEPGADSKDAVQQRYLPLARHPDEAPLFLELRRMDLEYSQTLAEARAYPDAAAYRGAVSVLDEAVWSALQFVRVLLLNETSHARP